LSFKHTNIATPEGFKMSYGLILLTLKLGAQIFRPSSFVTCVF